MSEPLPDFTDLASRLIYDNPSAPENYHPRYLTVTEGGLGWTAPAYAQMLDIPLFNEYMIAAYLAQGSAFVERVSLPPNLRRLSESSNKSRHEESYLNHFRTSAAALDCFRRKSFPNCPTMLALFKNWEQTCDKLVADPRFGDGWKLPAFFPLYSVTCKEAIDEFFGMKKISHPHLAVRWEEHRQHAAEQHYAWKETFRLKTSLHLVPFPRCLWYQKYHMIYEIDRPDLWEALFGVEDQESNVVDLTAD